MFTAVQEKTMVELLTKSPNLQHILFQKATPTPKVIPLLQNVPEFIVDSYSAVPQVANWKKKGIFLFFCFFFFVRYKELGRISNSQRR